MRLVTKMKIGLLCGKLYIKHPSLRKPIWKITKWGVSSKLKRLLK